MAEFARQVCSFHELVSILESEETVYEHMHQLTSCHKPPMIVAVLKDEQHDEDFDSHPPLPRARDLLECCRRSVRLSSAIARNRNVLALRLELYHSFDVVAVIEGIKHNQTLQTFEIDVCQAGLDYETGKLMAEAISHNTTIESFKIRAADPRVSDETGAAIAEALLYQTSLKSFEIDVSSCWHIGDATGFAIAQVVKLNTALKSLKVSLGSERFSDKTGVAIADAIKQNSTLKQFRIINSWHSQVGDETGVAIAEAVKLNTALESLDLSLGFISQTGDETGLAIAEAVKLNTTLKSFGISLRNTQITDKTGVKIAEAAKLKSTLNTLWIDISATQAGDETGLALAEVVKQNTALKSLELSLSGGQFSDQTGVAIADAIKQNSTLTNFRIIMQGLDYNSQISDETGLAIAEAVKLNSGLKSLHVSLRFTAITNQTGMNIAEALNLNKTLKTFWIDISDTQIGDETGLALAEAVKLNTALKSLTVHLESDEYGIYISSKTALAFADALKLNTTLSALKMRLGLTMTSDLGLEMAEAIRSNTTIQSLNLKFDTHFPFPKKSIQARNQALYAQRQTLLQLARWSDNTAFHCLTERSFRNMIFSFFFPTDCPFVPLDKGLSRASEGSFSQADTKQTSVCTAHSRLSQQEISDAKPSAAHGVSECCLPEPSKEEEQELDEAIETSRIEAMELETSDLAAAILQSKVDTPVRLNSDGVVVFRHAKSSEVAEAILTSPELEVCRQNVEEAGCELQPEWAGGTWFLLPLTREQWEEAGIQTDALHILMLSEHESAVKRALKSVPKSKRPSIRLETLEGDILKPDGNLVRQEFECVEVQVHGTDTTLTKDSDVEIVIERTFIHFRSRVEDAESSLSYHTAPF